MPDILRRQHAPIADAAWSELDEAAGDILRGMLTGRKIVDFSGPHGWEFASVNLGQVELAKKNAEGVGWGVRQVQPLIEYRIPFTLKQWEIDDLVRGKKDVDLDALEQAAQKAARMEDTAVFQGFKEGGIQGLSEAKAHKSIKLPTNAEQYVSAVAKGVQAIFEAGVGGPFALVLGTDPYFTLMQSAKTGYPAHRSVRDVLDGGPILRTPVLKGGLLVSTRGGDFELTVGKDLSIGYSSHDSEALHFVLTESFTFRILEPKAVVNLPANK